MFPKQFPKREMLMEPKITLNLGLTTLYQAVQTTLHKPKLSIVYHSLVNYEVDFLIGLVFKLLFFLFSHHQSGIHV